MAKRPARALLYCILMAVCFVYVGCDGCSGTPPKFHEVNLTPRGPIIVGSAGVQLITAVVLNDGSGAGVTWTPPANGTLTGVTTTSALYNAPAVAPGASVADSVKATSVTFPNQVSTLLITVEGAPVITTMVLPAGNYGSPYTATVTATGGVAPFTWSISAGSLTTGLSLSPSTTNSVMITGTPNAQVDSNFTIKVTDSTGASGTQPLTIAIGAPLPLTVTTTTLPNGVLNAVYPATTLQASGGVPPFTWMLTSGNLPAGLSLAADGSITGTPTATGTSNFSVQVSDSQSPAQTANANLSITVNNLSVLSGNYAFELNGFNSGGAVVLAGSFIADGAGNLTNGVEDFNTMAGPPKNQTFTGTYTLGADNRGTLTFTSLTGTPTYAFAIDSTGAHGRMIQFDSSGIRGSGQIEKRTISTCAFNTFSGQYAFGVSGQEIAGVSPTGPAVIVGSFQATPPAAQGGVGTLGQGEADSNAPGVVTLADGSLSGTYQTTAQATRCTLSFSPVNLNVGTMNFSAYPFSASEAFLVETDKVNTLTTPFLTAGKMIAQPGFPFSTLPGSTFTATSVGGLTGQFLSGTTYVPDLALVSLTGTGSNSYTISILENVAGSVITFVPGSPTFVSADQFGRVDSGISSPISPILYAIGNNEAFVIGEVINDPFFGILEPQSRGPFAAANFDGAFAEGTSAPATASVPDISGAVTLAHTSTTAGTVNGTEDVSASGGNTPDQTVTGTYKSLIAATGTGTLTLTAPAAFTGQFLIVSPTKLLLMSTTIGDVDPVMIFLGNCEATCGED